MASPVTIPLRRSVAPARAGGGGRRALGGRFRDFAAAATSPRLRGHSPDPALPKPFGGLLVPCAVAGCFILAVALRVLLARRGGLWIDEAQLIWTIRFSTVREVIHFVANHDSHPPLFYLLMRGWLGTFGDTEAAALAPGIILGAALVPALYLAGSRVFSPAAGLVAAALAACSPRLAWHSAEVRPYWLLALLCLLSTFALWVALRDRRDAGMLGNTRAGPGGARLGAWAVYAATTAAMLMTHNWAWLVWGGHGVVALAWLAARGVDATGGRSSVRAGVVAQLVIAAACAPWLPTLLHQARHAGHGPASVSLHDFAKAVSGLVFSFPAPGRTWLLAGLLAAAAWRPLFGLARRLGLPGRLELAARQMGVSWWQGVSPVPACAWAAGRSACACDHMTASASLGRRPDEPADHAGRVAADPPTGEQAHAGFPGTAPVVAPGAARVAAPGAGLGLALFLGAPAVAAVVAAALSWRNNLIVPHSMTVLSPCLLLAVAHAISRLPRWPSARAPAVLRVAPALLVTLVVSAAHARMLLGDTFVKSNAREVAAAVSARATPTDLTLVLPQWYGSSFYYYYAPDRPRAAYPDADFGGAFAYNNVAERHADPGALARLERHLREARSQGRRVWVITDRRWVNPADGGRHPAHLGAGAFRRVAFARAVEIRHLLDELYGPPQGDAIPRDHRPGWSMMHALLYAPPTRPGESPIYAGAGGEPRQRPTAPSPGRASIATVE